MSFSKEKDEKRGEKGSGIRITRPPSDDVTLVEDRNVESEKGRLRKRPLLGFQDEDGAYIKPSRFQTVEEHAGEDDDIDYRTLSWPKAFAIMLAETVSLGVLSLPSVFAEVGIEAGIILVIGMGLLATYTGYNLGLFKMAYPGVNNMFDAGEVIGGRWGARVLGFGQLIFLVFTCGSHVLTGIIGLDTISNSATCVLVWGILMFVVSALFSLPRTYGGYITYFSVGAFFSIMGSVMITMIGAGVTNPPGPVATSVHSTFQKAFLSVTNIVFAYAGHVAFLQFISEMAVPRDFPKALVALQITDTTIYVIVGLVVYIYVGSGATSPALGNLPFTLSRVAYGVALPTIVIAGVINGNVAGRLLMHRIYVKHGETPSRDYTHNTKRGWLIWVTIIFTIWVLAWIIAEVIPFFNDLLSVISSLFSAHFTYSLGGVFYLFFTPRFVWFESKRRTALTLFNFLIIVIGIFIMVGGLYASISDIADGYSSGKFGTPFTCTRPTG